MFRLSLGVVYHFAREFELEEAQRPAGPTAGKTHVSRRWRRDNTSMLTPHHLILAELVGLLKQFKDSECDSVADLTEQVHALMRTASASGAGPVLLAAFHRLW